MYSRVFFAWIALVSNVYSITWLQQSTSSCLLLSPVKLQVQTVTLFKMTSLTLRQSHFYNRWRHFAVKVISSHKGTKGGGGGMRPLCLSILSLIPRYKWPRIRIMLYPTGLDMFPIGYEFYADFYAWTMNCMQTARHGQWIVCGLPCSGYELYADCDS